MLCVALERRESVDVCACVCETEILSVAQILLNVLCCVSPSNGMHLQMCAYDCVCLCDLVCRTILLNVSRAVCRP